MEPFDYQFSPQANADLLRQMAQQQNIAHLSLMGLGQNSNASAYALHGSYFSDMARNAIPQDFTAELRGPMSERVLKDLASRNEARAKAAKRVRG